MSWSLFFATVAILYILYYAVVIGMDFLKSDKTNGDYKEETEQVSLSDLHDDDEEESPQEVISDEEDYEEYDSSVKKKPPFLKQEETQNLPKENINVQKNIVTQGIPLDQFKQEAKATTRAIYQ